MWSRKLAFPPIIFNSNVHNCKSVLGQMTCVLTYAYYGHLIHLSPSFPFFSSLFKGIEPRGALESNGFYRILQFQITNFIRSHHVIQEVNIFFFLGIQEVDID